MHTTSATSPRRVLLFSGHMIDAPGRDSPRFPPQQEKSARQALVQLLQDLDAGPRDRAVCSAACGGGLLFAEAATERGVPQQVYLPFAPDVFLQKSVAFAGGDWPARLNAVCAQNSLHLLPLERPPLVAGDDPYEQTNLWMLDAVSRDGGERVEFICLWDGQGGDRRSRSHRPRGPEGVPAAVGIHR